MAEIQLRDVEQTFLSFVVFPLPAAPISRQEFFLSPCISLLFLKHLKSGLEGTVGQVGNLPLGGSVEILRTSHM